MTEDTQSETTGEMSTGSDPALPGGDDEPKMEEEPGAPMPVPAPKFSLSEESIVDLALAIAGAMEKPSQELFLNEAATEPIMAALADGVRAVMRDYLAQDATVQIAHATLMESVRVGGGSETQHIDLETQKFKSRNVAMEWKNNALHVYWDSKGKDGESVTRKTMLIPSGNIRHMTPAAE